MTEDLNKILELDEVPTVKEALPDNKHRWARSARLSLISFLLAVVAFVIGVISLVAGFQTAGYMFDINGAFVVIAVICMIVLIVSVLTSLISGFIAVGRHNFVLWWLIPTLLVVGWFLSLLINDCM